MIRTILIIIGAIIGLAIIGISLMSFKMKSDKNLIIDFIKENPNTTAIKLVRNGETLLEHNGNKVMPLASTVKIAIAIEYAEQAASGKVDPEEMIPLADIDLYYVANTDGGAHPSCLSYTKENIVDEKISIADIAHGMILFSSNANTEWLSHKLGLDNINKRLEIMGITDHEEIYYIVSTLFVGKEMFPGKSGKELEKDLRDLCMEDYIAATQKIHKKLQSDSTYRKELGDLNFNIQKVWSDNLPGSTVSAYCDILDKMNSRTYFSQEVHNYLNPVMETLMQNPDNQSWLAHAGMKGGSTAFVLTKANYATDKKGNTTELAYFMDELGFFDGMKLQKSINEFELNILADEEFRNELVTQLAK